MLKYDNTHDKTIIIINTVTVNEISEVVIKKYYSWR